MISRSRALAGPVAPVVCRLDQATELQISAALPDAIEYVRISKAAFKRSNASRGMRERPQGGSARHFQVVRADALANERLVRLGRRIAAISNAASHGDAPR
jgi:hypothetical protein